MEINVVDDNFKVLAVGELKNSNVWLDGKRTDDVENTYFECVPLSIPMKDLLKGCRDKVFRVKLPKDFAEDVKELTTWQLSGLHLKVYQDFGSSGNPMKVTLSAQDAQQISG